MAARVIGGMAMSLDGFVTDRNGSAGALYPDMDAMHELDYVQESMRDTGAVIMGRHTYDMSSGDFTGYEYQVPLHIVTHQAPGKYAKGESDKLRLVFVTDGVESAVQKAKAAAGENKVVTVVGGANLIQQLLKAGLLDELQVDIVPVLLGAGLRLFEHLEQQDIKLEKIRVKDSTHYTHLQFRVVK